MADHDADNCLDLECVFCEEPPYEPQIGDRVKERVVPGSYAPDMGVWIVIGFTEDMPRRAILRPVDGAALRYEMMEGDAFERQPWRGGYVPV